VIWFIARRGPLLYDDGEDRWPAQVRACARDRQARKGRGGADAMWPDVMGPGWPWHLLTTAGLLTALLAVIGLVAKAALREEPTSPDPLLML
jgi:hypothetical protein